MAILTTEIDTFLSGGAANSDPDNSLGGVRSTTTELNPVVSEENLFNNVDGTEAAAGSVKFRGLYFENENASISLVATKIWFSTQTPSGDTVIAMALSAEGLNTTMEGPLANEDTVPATVSFTEPATKAGGLSMGTVPSLQDYGFWVRRTVTGGASAFDDDDWAYTIEGDTVA